MPLWRSFSPTLYGPPNVMSDSQHRPAGIYASGVRLIATRELAAYFDSPVACIYAAVFLVLSCGMYMNTFFLAGVIDLSPYFDALPFFLIPFAPAITMGMWAQEHAQNTVELVLTLPLTPGQVVLGKFTAALVFYGLVLAGSLPLVIMLAWLGQPDPGPIVTGYIGALLTGALFLAFGLFASGLTRDQIVAFVLAGLLGFIFVVSGHDQVVAVMDGLAPARQIGTWLYDSISIMPHYQAFGRGVVGLTHTLYFFLMTGFFLWMNQLTVQRIRY